MSDDVSNPQNPDSKVDAWAALALMTIVLAAVLFWLSGQ